MNTNNNFNPEALLKTFKSAKITPNDNCLEWNENGKADDIDNNLKSKSEDTYRKIASDIVITSTYQLSNQNNSKNKLKEVFTKFFTWFISIQYLVLVVILLLKSFIEDFYLGDTVIITYITSVFVETIGAIVIMITYAFDSRQEVSILRILNGVIKNYQKFGK